VFKNNYSQIRDEYIDVNKSLYAIHMQRWLDVFPLKQFLIIECEKFVSNPTKEMQRFEEFLSLPPFFTDVNFYNRTNDAPSFVCGRRNFTDHGVCMGKSKGLKHPNVSLDVVSRLRKYFSRMNKVFYKQVKINFNWPED
jgi:Sulfotransferase domain